MRQYIASEVETIVKNEVPLSLEALIGVVAKRMLQALFEFEVEAYVENCKTKKMNVVTGKWSGMVLTSSGN